MLFKINILNRVFSKELKVAITTVQDSMLYNSTKKMFMLTIMRQVMLKRSIAYNYRALKFLFLFLLFKQRVTAMLLSAMLPVSRQYYASYPIY